MTSDYTSRYKTYPGNNKLNMVFTIANYSLLQKFLSTVFLIIVCRTYLLFIIGLGCNLKNNNPSKAIAHACKVSGLPNHADQFIGTVTTLGMGNRVGYISLNRDPLKCLHATHPIDETIPNWETYGIAPFTLCQRGSAGYTHTLSLDLDDTKFQNGETLGFILVKNNQPPANLVNYLVKKQIPWPDQLCAYMHIQDCLILPGVIGQHVLQYAHHFDSFTDLNSYAHIYCYIKKGRHYCFIPLIHMVPETKTIYSAYSAPIPLPKEIPTIEADQASLDSGIDVRSVSALSLEADEPLDTLATIHEVSAGPIINHWETLHCATILTSIQTGILNIINRTIKALDLLQNSISNGNFGVEACLRSSNTPEYSGDCASPKNCSPQIGFDSGLLNDVPNQTIRPVLSNKTALTPALQAIENLQLALKRIATLGVETEGSEKLHSSKLTELTTHPGMVIEALANLEKAVADQHKEISRQEKAVLFGEELLNLMLSSLGDIYNMLLPVTRLKTVDESASTNYNLQALLIESGIQLEKIEKIILDLKKMQSAQLDMINDLKKVKNELLKLNLTDRLQKMETRLDTLVMELALDDIPLLSSLKPTFRTKNLIKKIIYPGYRC